MLREPPAGWAGDRESMSEKRETAVKFRVGLFVLLALATFLGGVYALGARARLFEARYTIHADFTEVGGLVEGATVRLAGVQIGRVSAVNLPPQPGGKVRVDLTIGRRFSDRIRKNSVARIETQGLLGDRIVEITVGDASAPPVAPGEVLASRDPADFGRVIAAGAETAKNVAALADALRETADQINKSKMIEDAASTVNKLGRVVDQVERGRGWAHTLLYEEPIALRRVNELIATTQTLVERVEKGQGAAGVLVSPESTASAKRFVAAMDRISAMVEQPEREPGLLPGLLFDPKYKAVLDDLRVVSHNLRVISDRVAGGKGTLGSLVADSEDDGTLSLTMQDLRTAVANLKSISVKINEGEGTVGLLIADPTIYERLVTILDGAQRSFLLRSMIRSLGDKGTKSKDDDTRR
jgi:phospholipid/cholesterol/gamma-HCH transport system substrate-binding protein